MSDTNQTVLAELVRRCDTDERVALCIVVRTRGSCPQSAGAKMLVTTGGQTVGTLGGGCVEAEVRKRAIELLNANTPAREETFSLDHDHGWDDGMICGGVMDVLLAPIDRTRSSPLAQNLADLRNNVSTTVRLTYERAGEQTEYSESIGPPPTLLIAGAGHVGQAIAALAPELGFVVSVIDDRPDMIAHERFPRAQQRIVGDIEQSLRDFPIDANTYIVVVTRGHQRDGKALATVIDSPARYIGMIGSKRKIKAIFDDLSQAGVSIEKLTRVHAPIGYELGAVTVPEIAISIAAELVAVRRGVGGASARPMKMDEAQLRAWLSRESDQKKHKPRRHEGPQSAA